jgi:hypothetical protein
LIKIFVLDSLILWDRYPLSFMLIAFKLLLLRPGNFLLSAYIDWLMPALAIAITDRFVRSDSLQRLGIIAVVGFLSALLNIAPYLLSPSRWQWGVGTCDRLRYRRNRLPLDTGTKKGTPKQAWLDIIQRDQLS